jgi:hypothetical protein
VRRPAFQVVALATFLVGCAVTKIDVDVYKGPLANHEDVQLQQFAMLAIGAEPLIRKLRDDLAEIDGKRRNERPPLLGQDPPPPGFELQVTEAILKLYKDRGDNTDLSQYPRLSAHVVSIRRALSRYDQALARLRAEQRAPVDPFRASPISAVAPAFKAFADGYRSVLADEGDRKRRDAIAHQFATLAPAARLTVNEMSRGTIPTQGAQKLSDDYVLRALTDRARVEAHAKILFSDPQSPEGRRFILRVLSIAQAFLDARDAMREAWLGTVDALIEVTGAPDRSLSAAAQKHAQEALTDLIADLTQPRSIEITACKAGGTTALTQRLQQWGLDLDRPRNWHITGAYSGPEEALQAALRSDPAGIATLLKKTDLSAVASALQPSTCHNDELGRLTFGIVRGPTLGEGQAARLDPAGLIGITERIVPIDLEKGRPEHGLFHLTQSFVDRSMQPHTPPKDEAYLSAREELSVALIQFASKVAFLADNRALFETEGSGEAKHVAQYTRILQAVANSILIHANELRERRAHAERSREPNRVAGERWALEHGLARSADAVLADLTKELEGEIARQTAVKQKIDDDKAAADAAATSGNATLPDLRAKIPPLEQAAAAPKKTYEDAQAALAQVEAACKVLADPTVKSAATNGAKANGKTVVEAVIASLETSVMPAALQDPAAPKRIALPYLKDLANKIDIAEAERPTVYVAIEQVVEGTAGDGKAYVAKAKLAYEAADKPRADAAKAVADAAAEIKRLEGNSTALKKKSDEIKAGIDVLQAAVDAIAEQHPAVIARANQAADPPSAKFVYERLKEAVKAAAANASGDRKTQLDAVVALLSTRNPPLESNRVYTPPAGTRDEKVTDVLDRLIAALREEHVLAVREAGVDSLRARALQDAIKAAYDHRSGMAYIRPASFYLRSSYAASALQPDAGLRWRNLLVESGERSSPFFSELFANYEDDNRLKIVSQLDKQFWENINSIRVSGAGLTNYAMVKDDIGNWYVKSYSADAESIIKSARGLALFNLGGAAAPDLLAHVKATDAQAATAQAGAPPSAPVQEKTGLERVLEKHRAAYTDKTKEDYDSALALAATSATRVDEAWTDNKGIKDEFRPVLAEHLAAARREYEKSLDTLKDAKPEERGLKIASALQSGRRFYQSIVAKIDGDGGISDADTKKSAKAEAARITRDLLDDFARRREAVVRDYEQSLTFIGEAGK